jgi:hypothetical protein
VVEIKTVAGGDRIDQGLEFGGGPCSSGLPPAVQGGGHDQAARGVGAVAAQAGISCPPGFAVTVAEMALNGRPHSPG